MTQLKRSISIFMITLAKCGLWQGVRYNSSFLSTSLLNATVKELLQESQLSQRDRATLCVIEYFAKPLKVTEGHSK